MEPFCASSPEAAGLTDDEFWDRVFGNQPSHEDVFGFGVWDEGGWQEPQEPCPECGQVGPCGYDAEGRPMIHVVDGEGE